MTGIKTRLYIVEGPPGSGKSEAAQFITEAAGRNAMMFDEDNMDHPADYTFHAFMTEDQIRSLPAEDRCQIFSESIKTNAGYVFPMTKISVSLFGKVLPYKIYGNLDWETERPVILEYWRSFAKKARMMNGLNVFVGSLLKNPVAETMMRFDMDFAEINAYVREICKCIAPLNPTVIYLRNTDIAGRIAEYAEYQNAVRLRCAVADHDAQPYAKSRGLTGFEGYTRCLQARQEAELRILDSLPVKKLILTDAHLDWDGAYEQITQLVSGKVLLKS